jgi:hypothetical protein
MILAFRLSINRVLFQCGKVLNKMFADHLIKILPIVKNIIGEITIFRTCCAQALHHEDNKKCMCESNYCLHSIFT